ncbi:hypothetical protein LOAG_14293, partial [Loa loa]
VFIMELNNEDKYGTGDNHRCLSSFYDFVYEKPFGRKLIVRTDGGRKGGRNNKRERKREEEKERERERKSEEIPLRILRTDPYLNQTIHICKRAYRLQAQHPVFNP